jgi:hypothetical protein
MTEPRLIVASRKDRLRKQIAIVSRMPARSSVVKIMLAAQKRERDQVLAEMVKIRGLMPLLMKPRNGTHWTRGERAELVGQVKAIAHLSPYLVVMVLPGSFVILPLLAWWLDRRRHQREDHLTSA